jgi:predicted O-linked N-acetylglucosamine transferase (SPINDLY family)
LVLKARQLADQGARRRILQGLSGRGISEERVALLGFSDSGEQHLSAYNTVDIALDTFPYTGTTTTCEALLMGVPVITCTGTTHASRVSASLLDSVGLTHLVCDSAGTAAGLAQKLAASPEVLAKLRASLRAALIGSPLCDPHRFTNNLEVAFTSVLAA